MLKLNCETAPFVNSGCVSLIERIVEAIESAEENSNESITDAGPILENPFENLSNSSIPENGGMTIHKVTESDTQYTIFLQTNYADLPIIEEARFINFETKESRESQYGFYKWRTSGGATVGSGEIYYNEYKDKDSGVFLQTATTPYYGGVNNSDIISYRDFQVGGVSVSNLPTGTHEYNGGSLVGLRHNAKTSYIIQFAMSVDFSDSTGNIREFEPSSTNLEGPISINTDGTFFSDSLQLKINNRETGENFPDSATINGSFHNENATGVTGIYFDNTRRDYLGALWGARVDIR